MSAQLSEQFHVKLAKEFVEALTVAEKDNIYLFIGRSTPWPNSADTNSAAIPLPSTSVANGTYDYWRDMFALIRISANDTSHVVPRKTWSVNTRYSMYDHRIPRSELFANSNPVYVMNSSRDVFKCLYNGRVNSTSNGSQSTVEPDIQFVESFTELLTTPGNPKEYIWKYLYTVSDPTNPYLTNDYMPVKATHDTLNPTTGDVQDDGSKQYNVFNTARLTNNGAIYTVVVEEPGAGYSSTPDIKITGDGSGAEAQAVLENNAVSRIYMTSYGQHFSYAKVSISGGGPSVAASATAIISPRHSFANVTLGGASSNTIKTYYRTNHGIDLEQELNAKYVMIYRKLEPDITDILPTASTSEPYRRIGLVRNPLLAGTANVASAEFYTTLTRLTIPVSDISKFRTNEIIRQSSTNACGVLVGTTGGQLWLSNVRGTFVVNQAIQGIGNGDASGYISGTVPPLPDAFTPVIAASGGTSIPSAVTPPLVQPYSGDILFVNHDTPTTRSGQTQTVRIVLTF